MTKAELVEFYRVSAKLAREAGMDILSSYMIGFADGLRSSMGETGGFNAIIENCSVLEKESSECAIHESSCFYYKDDKCAGGKCTAPWDKYDCHWFRGIDADAN